MLKIQKLGSFQDISNPSSKYDVTDTALAISNDNDVTLWDLNEGSQDEGILLHGHHTQVTTVTFSRHHDNDDIILATGASDYIIMWKLGEVLAAHNNGTLVRGHIFSSTSGESPNILRFSPRTIYFCDVTDNQLIVYDYDNTKIIFTESCRDVSSMDFQSDTRVVTVTTAGRINIWDVAQCCLVWQHTMVQGLSCVTANEEKLFVTSVSSVVSFTTPNPELRFHFEKDLDLCLLHHSWDGDVTKGIVLSLLCVESPHCDVISRSSVTFVLCAMNRVIVAINCDNQESIVMQYIDCDVIEPIVASQACLSQDPKTKKITCCVTSMLDPTTHVFHLTLPTPNNPLYNPTTLTPTFVSSTPLADTSPLRGQIKFNKTATPTNDQPITFKNKVKSSGYKSSPRMSMFTPKTNAPRKVTKQLKLKCRETEPSDWSMLMTSQGGATGCSAPVSVRSIAVDETTKQFASVFNDNSVQVMSLPLLASNNKVKHVTGASNTLGCSWSHGASWHGASRHGGWLLTHTNDSVAVWGSPYTNTAALTFSIFGDEDKKQHQTKEIVSSQFYYLDKFILVGCGNSLSLFKFHLEEKCGDEIKRYLWKGKSKLVCSQEATSGQNISSFAAANNYYSYIMLVGGSDRNINLYDFNVCKAIGSYKNAHSKPTHTINIATGSSLVTSSNDLFMTSAISDGIKIWDLRTTSSILKLNQHSNKTKSSSCLTPCGRYIATTCDEKSVYVYDCRSYFPLQILKLKSKPTCLRFTPCSTQLLVGTDSSKISSFSVKK
ncbi:WD repeat-containing protein 27-like [Ciona intestinalis]